MMDDLDWERECREFNEVVRAHQDRPLPEGVLADHHRIFMAKLRADQVERAKLLAANPNIDWRL